MEPLSDEIGENVTSVRVPDQAFPVASGETGKERCPEYKQVMLSMHNQVSGTNDCAVDPDVVEKADDLACAVGLQIELKSLGASDAIRILRNVTLPGAAPAEKDVCVSLSILEQVHDYGPGGRVWDAALVLGSHMAKTFGAKEEGMTGKLAIEIGAGTGLCGIACSKLGATTCITDKDYVLPLLWANASLNCDDEVKRGELWAERIEWGQRLPKRLLRQGWDYVLCSDVVGCGDEALFPPLIKTLKQLCSDDTTLLMSYKPRASFERIFFDEASKYFSIKRLERVTLPQTSRMEAYHSPVDVLCFRVLTTRTELPTEFLFDYTFDDDDE